jgi:hypothetical protein
MGLRRVDFKHQLGTCRSLKPSSGIKKGRRLKNFEFIATGCRTGLSNFGESV